MEQPKLGGAHKHHQVQPKEHLKLEENHGDHRGQLTPKLEGTHQAHQTPTTRLRISTPANNSEKDAKALKVLPIFFIIIIIFLFFF